MRAAKVVLTGIIFIVGAMMLAGYGFAQEKASGQSIQVEHQKVEASYKHALPIPDLFTGQSGSANYRVRASRHDEPTQVEVHTQDTDIFYVTSGAATFISGGTGVGMKESSPNELRGTSISGGTTYHLTKGDVMMVPRGIPHWFQAIPTAPFLYLEVKVR
jgi:mannose-6-phosphate isomerase-like protein (cupin superfamily)